MTAAEQARRELQQRRRTREHAALVAFQRRYGARVRRSEAMAILCISDSRIFHKVVDATPGLAHRVPGERQAKYVTAVLYFLLPVQTRCAT